MPSLLLMSVENRKTILSAMKPSGGLHLGNYLGAARVWASLLDEYECFIPLVDMHAITVPYVPSELRGNTLDCVAQYIACGLNPGKCHIFVQSHVIGHAELAWILGCITGIGQLQRMTQFKDKSAKQTGPVGSGLLYYPVLMAADILLYNADLVPVGDDQKQHVELTRDIAEKFNRTYSETFVIPEPFIPEVGARVMSLQHPDRKMDKSEEDKSGVLSLQDAPQAVRKKIRSAVTDSGQEIEAREDKPGITNLLNIMSAVSGCSISDLEREFAGQGYGRFKDAVADCVIAALEPIQSRYRELIQDKAYLTGVLKRGAEVAQKRANRMLRKVYRKVGFVELAE